MPGLGALRAGFHGSAVTPTGPRSAAATVIGVAFASPALADMDWDGGPDAAEDTDGLTDGRKQAPSILPPSATPECGGLDHAAEVAERMSPVSGATARRTAS